jgi:hypothetical protein
VPCWAMFGLGRLSILIVLAYYGTVIRNINLLAVNIYMINKNICFN